MLEGSCLASSFLEQTSRMAGVCGPAVGRSGAEQGEGLDSTWRRQAVLHCHWLSRVCCPLGQVRRMSLVGFWSFVLLSLPCCFSPATVPLLQKSQVPSLEFKDN